jgi:tetratricopeptide (TPR) repeat protein
MNRLIQIQQMLEETPGDPFLHFALAKEWEAQGNISNALEAWAWFPKHDPEYNGFYYHYVQLLRKADRMAEAGEVLARGLEVIRRQGDHHAFSELLSLQDPFEEEDED